MFVMAAIGSSSSSSAPAPPSDGLYTPPHSSLSLLSLSLIELVLGHHVYHEMLKSVPLYPLLDDPVGLTAYSLVIAHLFV
jgi:hypothetical protein